MDDPFVDEYPLLKRDPLTGGLAKKSGTAVTNDSMMRCLAVRKSKATAAASVSSKKSYTKAMILKLKLTNAKIVTNGDINFSYAD